jgi:hypothetical protein
MCAIDGNVCGVRLGSNSLEALSQAALTPLRPRESYRRSRGYQ